MLVSAIISFLTKEIAFWAWQIVCFIFFFHTFTADFSPPIMGTHSKLHLHAQEVQI